MAGMKSRSAGLVRRLPAAIGGVLVRCLQDYKKLEII
jgi:hypothetical protein